MSGSHVVEVAYLRLRELQPGAAVVGRIDGVLNDMTFVDVGQGAPGLVRRAIKSPVGSLVVVQISTPPRGEKGASLRMISDQVPEGGQVGDIVAPAPNKAVSWCTLYRTVTDVLVDDATEARRLQTMLPAYVSIRVQGSDGERLFDQFGVTEAIDASLRPTVRLPSGGSIIIETTAALTTIDVNSGAGTADAANSEAVQAIADAIRLRNIGGTILIDPIAGKKGVVNTAHRMGLALVDVLAEDPVRPSVSSSRKLGVVKISRQRVGQSLHELLIGPEKPKPVVLSATTVAYAALREAVAVARSRASAGAEIHAAPAVIALLQGRLQPVLAEASAADHVTLKLKARADWAADRFEISPA